MKGRRLLAISLTVVGGLLWASPWLSYQVRYRTSHRYLEPIATAIKTYLAPEELFACNRKEIAQALSFLTNRATSLDRWDQAKLIVWIKEGASHQPSLQLQRTALQYRLQPLGETQMAHLMFNRSATGKRKTAPTPLPRWIFLILAGLGGSLLWWDLRCRSSGRGTSPKQSLKHRTPAS